MHKKTSSLRSPSQQMKMLSNRPTPPFSAIDKFLAAQTDQPEESHCEATFNECHDYAKTMLARPSDSDHSCPDNTGKRKSISNVSQNEEPEAVKIISKRLNDDNQVKGKWTKEEDRKLLELVNLHGTRQWSQIAENIEGRAGKQCRERWNNHLRPNIKKEEWSEEEERKLVEAHAKYGNQWAKIVKILPGRTENSIKNHYYATKRNRHLRARYNGKAFNVQDKKKNSILESYIKSQSIESNSNFKSFTPSLVTDALSDATLPDFAQVWNPYIDDGKRAASTFVFDGSESLLNVDNISFSSVSMGSQLHPTAYNDFQLNQAGLFLPGESNYLECLESPTFSSCSSTGTLYLSNYDGSSPKSTMSSWYRHDELPSLRSSGHFDATKINEYHMCMPNMATGDAFEHFSIERENLGGQEFIDPNYIYGGDIDTLARIYMSAVS